MKILIVDDSEMIRERLQEQLEEIGKIEQIDVADDSASAFHHFESRQQDLIILEIQLPGENGIKILEEIRSNDAEVTIVILTNYPYPQYRKRCMELKANYFLDKSRDFKLVISICRELLEKQQV